MVKTQYLTRDRFAGFADSHAFVEQYLERRGVSNILEIGAGANPTLRLSYLDQHPWLSYTANDVDTNELAKVNPRFTALLADFTQPEIRLDRSYDLIFSRNVNEHVKSGRDYYTNIYNTLVPGGYTFHFFSTLYSLPFLVNYLTPEYVSEPLLKIFAPRDDFKQGKFRAYYDWSRGPSRRMIQRFESIGFEVVQYDGYFGHKYYEQRSKLLHQIATLKSRFLAKYPINLLTSYAFVELRRPL